MPYNKYLRSGRYDQCPVCSEKKDKRAKVCINCRNSFYNFSRPIAQNSRQSVSPIHYDKITDLWIAEFRGFFLGEGTVSIAKANSGSAKKTSVRIQISISQSARALSYMCAIQERFGGRLTNVWHPSDRSPMVRWYRSGLSEVLEILKMIQDPSNQHPKMREVELGIEFIQWRKSVPHHYSEEERAYAHTFIGRLADIRLLK